MFNSGQVCVSIERVYVEAPVYDEFVAKLADKVRDVKQGQSRPASPSTPAPWPPTRNVTSSNVTSPRPPPRVPILVGGKPTGKGTFFQPTVLTDVTQDMTCVAEETFGPTLPVIKVKDEEEAIRLANDSKYGLSATVWTGDVDRGERIARRLECGAVSVNDDDKRVRLRAADGWLEGVRHGYRAGGANGILKFCRAQAITAPRIPTQKSEMLWYSSPKKQGLFALAVDVSLRGAWPAPLRHQAVEGYCAGYPGGLGLSTQKSTPSSKPGTQS